MPTRGDLRGPVSFRFGASMGATPLSRYPRPSRGAAGRSLRGMASAHSPINTVRNALLPRCQGELGSQPRA